MTHLEEDEDVDGEVGEASVIRFSAIAAADEDDEPLDSGDMSTGEKMHGSGGADVPTGGAGAGGGGVEPVP